MANKWHPGEKAILGGIGGTPVLVHNTVNGGLEYKVELTGVSTLFVGFRIFNEASLLEPATGLPR